MSAVASESRAGARRARARARRSGRHVDDAVRRRDLCAALLAGGISLRRDHLSHRCGGRGARTRGRDRRHARGRGHRAVGRAGARPRVDAGARVRRRAGDGRRGRRRAAQSSGCRSSRASRRRPSSGTRVRSGARSSRSSRRARSAGPAFLRAVSATFPQVRFIPTGGIDADIARARTSPSPSVLACGGSWICEPGLIRERRFDEIEQRARAAASAAPMTQLLSLRRSEECRYDLVALGEVMLRLDPGDGRIATTRSFRVWEGGGEYNVARGLRRCFGLRTGDRHRARRQPGRPADRGPDAPGRRRADPRSSGAPYDGIGREVRNGLNFTERGFGVRGAVGCSDRGHTAASQLRPGDVDWERDLRRRRRALVPHAAASSARSRETAAELALEAMAAARRHGTVVSYDLNYPAVALEGARRIGGGGRDVNRGSSGTSTSSSGTRRTSPPRSAIPSRASTRTSLELDVGALRAAARATCSTIYPQLALVATTLRQARTATVNDWSAVCRTRDGFFVGPAIRGARDLRPRRRRRLVRLRADLRAARAARGRRRRRSRTASRTARSR